MPWNMLPSGSSLDAVQRVGGVRLSRDVASYRGEKITARGLIGHALEFPMTFLDLIGSDPQLLVALAHPLAASGWLPSHRDRSDVCCRRRYSDRESGYAAKRPGRFFEKSQCLGAFGRLILVEEPRKDRGAVINNRICDQPTALIADFDVDIRLTAQLFLAPYLGNRRSELMIGLDAVLRTMDVTLQL